MIRPLWAVAGIAILGTAGVAGAVIVASSGGEEEVVQQVATGTPVVTGTGTPVATVLATASASATPPPPATPTPAGGTITYTNPVYGYSLDYPSDWFLYTDPGGYTIITSYDPSAARTGGGVPGNVIKVDISVRENPRGLALEEWVAQADADLKTDPVTVVSASEVQSPRQGIFREIRSGEGSTAKQYWFSFGSRIISVTGIPADSSLGDRLGAIVSTLRFAQ